MIKWLKNKEELMRKSIAASLLIGLGNYALLKLGNPIGPIIFAFGLLGVCYMGLNLFTGKCGFLIEDKIKITDLIIILIINLISGYLFGLLFRVADSSLIEVAINKVNTWDVSISYFVKSLLCGCIMYIAVYMYRKNTPLGIIYGIPLFIFCSFQHCIANIITLGVAFTFDLSILICILGNFVGSLFVWFISRKKENK